MNAGAVTMLAASYARDPQKVCDYFSDLMTSGSLPPSRTANIKRHLKAREVAQALIDSDDAKFCRLLREYVAAEALDEAKWDAEDAA